MSDAKVLFRPKEYLKPTSIEEAVKLLAQFADKGSAVAGGTDILAMKNPNIEILIDITGLGLSYIKPQGKELRIGATTTLYSIEKSPVINNCPYSILAQGAHKVGTPLIRNLGTIGGNLCNASPSADTPAALLALGARLKLVGTRGTREVPLDEFFAGPFRTIKEHGELLTEIILPPLSPRTGTSYQSFTKNNKIDESLVGVATLVVLDGRGSGEVIKDVRIGLISVAPKPMRAIKAEKMLLGKAINDELIKSASKVVAEEIKPRSRANYRRDMSVLLAGQTIKEAIARARKAAA
jgi:carbon-monoxide dehydrogenase medium subunit